MNKFSFLYCCLYKWSEQVNGRNYPNAYSASVMLSFILMLIGGAFFSLASVFLELNVAKLPYRHIAAALFVVAIFIGVHGYFTFRERYLRLLREFDSSSNGFRDRPGVVVAVSLGFSLSFLFAVWCILLGIKG